MDWVHEFYAQQGALTGVYGGPVEDHHRAKVGIIERLTGSRPRRVLELGAGGGQCAAAADDVDLYGGSLAIRFGDEWRLAEDEEHDIIGFETTIGLRASAGKGQMTGLRVPDDLGKHGGFLNYAPVDVTLSELSLVLSSALYF
jgi:hypothetical protein